MKVIAINGSPRPNHNTGILLKKAVEGAVSKGAETEIINLYKLNYKGCIACMSCKRKGSKSSHSCAVRDDLTPVFEKIKDADAVIFGSPIYFSDITGEMRSFLERLLFEYLPYDSSVTDGTYFPRELKTAFVYTMGVPQDSMEEGMQPIENFISMIFRTPIKTLYSKGNYPFLDDWSNYEASDLSGLKKSKDETIQEEYEKAFQLGVDLASDKN